MSCVPRGWLSPWNLVKAADSKVDKVGVCAHKRSHFSYIAQRGVGLFNQDEGEGVLNRRDWIRLPRRSKKRPEASEVRAPVLKPDHYTGLARDAAKRLTTSTLVWMVALLGSFVLVESELSKRLTELSKNLSDQSSLRDSIAKASPERVGELRQKLQVLQANKRDLGAPINFPLPGLTPIPITPALAPAIWLFVSCLVLSHLWRLRSHAHGYLALALAHTTMPERGLPIAAPWRPLLVPLPTRDGREISAQHFAASYGLTNKDGLRLPVIALAFCLLGAQSWMLFVQSNLADFLKPRWFANLLWWTSVASVGVTIALWWQWLRPWSVPDDVFRANGQSVRHRREVMQLAFGASAMSLMAIALPRYLAPAMPGVRDSLRPVLAGIRWKPRFRLSKKTGDVPIKLKDGLILNPRTNTVHLALARRVFDVGAERTLTTRFSPLTIPELLSLATAGKLRLRRSHAAFFADQALRLRNGARKGTSQEPADRTESPEQELNLLLVAIRTDLAFKRKSDRTGTVRLQPKSKDVATTPPGMAEKYVNIPTVSIHLYDRFAALAVSSGSPKRVNELVEFMRTEGLTDAFGGRITKWTDQQSKWFIQKSRQSTSLS